MTIKKKGHRHFVYLVVRCDFINWIGHTHRNIWMIWKQSEKIEYRKKPTSMVHYLAESYARSVTFCYKTLPHTHYAEMANSTGFMSLLNEQMWKTNDRKCVKKIWMKLIWFHSISMFSFFLCLVLLYSQVHTFSHVLLQFNRDSHVTIPVYTNKCIPLKTQMNIKICVKKSLI